MVDVNIYVSMIKEGKSQEAMLYRNGLAFIPQGGSIIHIWKNLHGHRPYSWYMRHHLRVGVFANLLFQYQTWNRTLNGKCIKMSTNIPKIDIRKRTQYLNC